MTPLRAWLLLIALSAATTALALAGAPGLLILAIAWLKARLILGVYLGLDHAPSMRRGFDVVLALMLAGMGGLYLAG